MTRTRTMHCFHDEAHFRRFLWGLVVLAIFAGLGLVLVPLAHAVSFSCDKSGNASANLFSIYDTQTNTISNGAGSNTSINSTANSGVNSSGVLNDNADPYGATGACSSSLGIFGRVVCYFRNSVGEIVSHMYCVFQNQLQGPITLAITLFVMVMGIFIMTGITQFSMRESMIALFKVAIIYVFATNANWGIGVGYAFFMALAEQGSTIMLTAGSNGAMTTGGAALTSPDKVIGSLMNVTTLGGSSINGITLDPICAFNLILLFILLVIFAPFIAVFIGNVILQYLWIYIRALLGYLTALVLIGFLFVLSPLFVCFALFQVTRPLFDQWLKYLTTFSLQMVIVFAFLAVLNMVPVGDFFTEILGLLRKDNQTLSSGGTVMPFAGCGICKYLISNTVTLGSYFSANSGTIANSGAALPITCDPTSSATISITQLFVSQDLISAIVSQAAALWIVGHIMQDFLIQAPDIARDLTGRMPFAAALGQSGANPLSASTIEYAGLNAAESFTKSLPDRLLGGKALSAGGMARRGLFAAGLVGATGAFRYLSGGGSSGSGDATQTGVQRTAAENASLMQRARLGTGAKDKAQTDRQGTVSRNAMGAAPLLMGYEKAMINYASAHDNVETNYTEVQEALQTVERLKASEVSDPLAMREAMRVLKLADEKYMIAWTNLDKSQNAMMAQRKSLSSVMPLEDINSTFNAVGKLGMGSEEDGMSSTSDGNTMLSYIAGTEGGQEGGSATATATQTGNAVNDDGFTHAELKTYADQTAQNLQFQMHVQSVLLSDMSPSDPGYKDKSDRLIYAEQTFNEAMSSMRGNQTAAETEAVLKKLYIVQRALS